MKKVIAVVMLSLLAFASPSYAWFTPDGADVTKSGITFEGATNDAYEHRVIVNDPVADQVTLLPIVTALASLPAASSANKGQIAVLTDAASATDCSAGGNTFVNVCVSPGTGNWANVA